MNDPRELSWPALTLQARRFVWSVALGAGLCLGICSQLHAQARPSPAQAARDKERDQQARTHFELGRAAYEDGRYRDAWVEFREAYRLSQRPELLFNIGQSADRLGEDADALTAFEMYLDRLPEAENRREVENRVRALRERVEAEERAKAEAKKQAESAAAIQASAARQREAREAEAAQKRRRSREAREARRNSPPTVAPLTARAPRSWRRGLLLRIAAGLGLRTDSVSSNDLTATILGFGFSLDLQAGYAVAPGLVVGGGVFFDWGWANHLSAKDQQGQKVTGVHVDHANLVMLGPFVDWYPKRQSLGLHVEAGVGAELLSVQYTDNSDQVVARTNAAGIGLFVGGGYEWFLGHGLAAGALLRLTGASITDSGESHAVFTPSLLASLTWF